MRRRIAAISGVRPRIVSRRMDFGKLGPEHSGHHDGETGGDIELRFPAEGRHEIGREEAARGGAHRVAATHQRHHRGAPAPGRELVHDHNAQGDDGAEAQPGEETEHGEHIEIVGGGDHGP